jgi:hypothetical protein
MPPFTFEFSGDATRYQNLRHREVPGQIARKSSILRDSGTSFLFTKNGSLTPLDFIFITGYSWFFYSS